MSLRKWQTKIQLWFESKFSKWADIVSNRTWLVFSISLLLNIMLCKDLFVFSTISLSISVDLNAHLNYCTSLGFGYIFFASNIKDANLNWTPAVSVIALKREKLTTRHNQN